ncbi:RhoGAP domain containing protein [Histomonas meleagridis]|uniref:RhoGAP domain containing protein n=1 Tax=Histomonas meleagridis TaxID=135588 RepID=UPI00355AC20E|nr:RhoGAP domain containing protein [Histomonas meleagridis]KAH0806428.1 RhoGAP domain containing protein [Histomonas meleagridis]
MQISYKQASHNSLRSLVRNENGKLRSTPLLTKHTNSQQKIITRHRGRKATLFSCETKISSDLPPYLPLSILTDKDTVLFQDFAQKNFRKVGKKKSNARADVLSYDENPNMMPLLEISDSKLAKKAVLTFTYIVHYMNDSETTPISQFIHIANESPILIDETYVELLRQVYTCKSNDACYRGWDLILVMCTILIPSQKVQSLVRSFLSTYSYDINKVIARISRLSYIRFVTLIKGKPPSDLNDTYIDTIIENKLRHLFGSSLSEILYVQNFYSYNNSPLPLFLQKLCETLIARGDVEDILFNTDSERLNSLVVDIEAGKDVLQNATVKELGSLLKRFLSKLQPPLISINDVKDVPLDDIPKVINNLPKIQKDTLAYLTQFIRKICKNGNKDVEPYAQIISSNIVQIQDLPKDCIKEYVHLAKVTMLKLIADWNVDSMDVTSGNDTNKESNVE